MADESPFSRIEDEVEWEEHSPSTYLLQAFTALLEVFDPGKEGLSAATNRVNWSRIAIIYAAFAGEGFINRALMLRLGGSDFAAVDRLATVDKYALGPVLAVGESLFDRGAEPLQTIKRMFDLRNAMAHPKPKTRTITRAELFADPEADVFKPADAVAFVVAVAEAALTLSNALGEDPNPFAEIISGMSGDFERLAAKVDALPRMTQREYEEAWERVKASEEERGGK